MAHLLGFLSSSHPFESQSKWDTEIQLPESPASGRCSRDYSRVPLSERNYLHAVNILHDRFGQTHKLVAAHMQSLLNIPKPSNTLNSLCTFHNTIESHSRGLFSLGKLEETYGDLLVPIILSELPSDTRQNLARESTTPEWTFPQLKLAILKEIRILESGSAHSYQSTLSTAAFLVNSKPPRSGKSHDKAPQSCVFCKGPHAPHQCSTVADHRRRLDIVRQNNLCFNCLARHKISQYASKFQCRNCKRKHHKSLCNGDQRSDTQNPPVTPPVTVQLPPTTTPLPVASLLTPTNTALLVY